MTIRLLSARIQSPTTLLLSFNRPAEGIFVESISLLPRLPVASVERLEHLLLVHTAASFDLKKQYAVLVRGVGTHAAIPDRILDSLETDKPLGCRFEEGSYVFRLFAPRAVKVQVVLFASLADEIGTTFDMIEGEPGVWELSIDDSYITRYYCYRVHGPAGEGEMFDGSLRIADPYSPAVERRNNYLQEACTIIGGGEFDWQGDAHVRIRPEDLILYEMHLRDMTAHASSGVPEAERGTYAGLARGGCAGGLDYIASLGVNAVELLPAQEYAAIEPPYKQLVPENIFNTWNPYARNHWGYMTSFFFAPHSGYAIGVDARAGAWNGAAGRQVTEFKEMVSAFHKRGIAVIMDVVYNHTSQYDRQPLKHIDRRYYYRSDETGAFLAASGCGNDLATARPMARRLIVDSILHWIKEYHVDGFRFDLATLIDWETFEELQTRAKEANPDVILIAEAWGGGLYDLEGFSRRGVAAWNDIFRNEVKGHNPHNGRGFVFGTWLTPVTATFRRWVLGSTVKTGGPFTSAFHSVNYLESHDGYTLGDFIRIASEEVEEEAVIADRIAHARLTERQMRFHKLAAFVLFVSQGIPMLHAGQEFARSKVVAPSSIPDAPVGRMDPNSYEKDDETNWIDYRHAEINRDLREYYRGLIALRAALPELRGAPPDDYRFFDGQHIRACGFALRKAGEEVYLALVNSSAEWEARFPLPDGMWSLLVDSAGAGLHVRAKGIAGSVTLPPTSAMFLVREFESSFG